MKKISPVVCFDFDDVIIDGNPLSKLKLPIMEELHLGIELIEDNKNPKKFFRLIKEIVSFVKGMKFSTIEKTMLKAKPTDGAKETLKELASSSKVVIVSINDERIIKKSCRSRT